MKLLTIIPARGGSKGVPGKNRIPVYGKPLVAWTIECALCTDVSQKIVVSSDDVSILSIAKCYENVVASYRPDSLSQDQTPITEVIEYLLSQEEAGGCPPYDAVLLLQPTAPIREPRHILGVINALKSGINSVISVVEMRDLHPARMYRLECDELSPLIPEYEHARRQDIPPAYYRNGSIYLVRTEAFRMQRTVMAKPSAGYLMEGNLLLNIDEPRDMLIAEPLIAAWQEGRL